MMSRLLARKGIGEQWVMDTAEKTHRVAVGRRYLLLLLPPPVVVFSMFFLVHFLHVYPPEHEVAYLSCR